MKTLDDFKQEQMKDEDFKREYDEIQFIANSRAIQELEKIKVEIGERCIFSISKIDVLDIIDKYISELKGE